LLTSLFGFFLFYLLENISDLDPRGEPGSVLHHTHGHTTGLWAALGISVHSFLDGVAIAQGFEAAARLGWTVALGVAMHKFADGVSVIGVMQGTHQGGRSTLTMLSVVALAPILGAAAQPFLDIPTRIQALLFGWFAGVFLYLGATSLLPAAHEAGHSRGLPLWALGGALLVYTAQLLVG
jgi:zinc transporter ZupT